MTAVTNEETISLRIYGVTSEGQGVGRLDGLAVFVAGALPGEIVTARITKRKKGYALARLEQVIEPAPGRVAPGCPHYARCGGCGLQHADYDTELEIKRCIVQQSLRRLGPGEAEVPLPLPSPKPTAYRNRAVLHYDHGRLGFYNSNSHTVAPLTYCDLLDPAINGLLERVQAALSASDADLSDLRGVSLRCDSAGQRLMLTFVCRQSLTALDDLSRELVREETGLVSVWENHGPPVYGVYGAAWRHLAGSERLRDSIGPVRLDLSPGSFLQVNHAQAVVLYDTVRRFAGLDGSQSVLDLYSGVGSIALYLAASARRVTGVESYGPAVADALEAAALNGVDNCRFQQGRAEDVLPGWAISGRRFDVAVLDPPRAGCDKRLLAALTRIAPQQLVYVSCDPATLARDLRLLCERGYTVKKLQPIDMFPRTHHVETVCALSKLSEAKHHISVQVDMDELDVTAAESKATYEEIQAWVQEKYGFHVTHLNIAQVKRKHGIIERENYNKPKSPDSRQRGCPEDKTKAIEAALRFYQMI